MNASMKWLGEVQRNHPVFVAITTVVVALLGLGVDKLYDVAKESAWTQYTFVVCLLLWVLVLLACALAGVAHKKQEDDETEAWRAKVSAGIDREKELQEKLKTGEDNTIRALLQYLVDNIAPSVPTSQLRACVMFLDDSRTRRVVHARTAINFHDSADRELSLENTAGASGEAVRQQKTVYSDRKKTRIGNGKSKRGDRDQGMTPTEKSKLPATLEALLCTCLTNGSGVIGTLNVDAHSEEAARALNSLPASRLLEAVANAVALVRTSSHADAAPAAK